MACCCIPAQQPAGWCTGGPDGPLTVRVLRASPTQADGRGAELSAPNAPAGTNRAAQFSVEWVDVPPALIGEDQAAAFKAAILRQLPPGGLPLEARCAASTRALLLLCARGRCC